MQHEWRYLATLQEAVDGDTITISIDLGFYTSRLERVRLLGSAGGVDTPELHSRDPEERVRANLARARVLALVPPGTQVRVITERDRRDGFGRFLAQVLLEDGRNLGDVLLSEGLAVPWVR